MRVELINTRATKFLRIQCKNRNIAILYIYNERRFERGIRSSQRKRNALCGRHRIGIVYLYHKCMHLTFLKAVRYKGDRVQPLPPTNFLRILWTTWSASESGFCCYCVTQWRDPPLPLPLPFFHATLFYRYTVIHYGICNEGCTSECRGATIRMYTEKTTDVPIRMVRELQRLTKSEGQESKSALVAYTL